MDYAEDEWGQSLQKNVHKIINYCIYMLKLNAFFNQYIILCFQ
jgi:hypothetical protein